MGDAMTRIFLQTTVRKAIRDMKDSPERSSRNLLDMALEFAEGRFQQNLFREIRGMLNNNSSAYYSLVKNIVQHVDEDRLLTFGMNVGYNSCTAGAQKIRTIEAKEHYNIPWTLCLQMGKENQPELLEKYCRLIDQGEYLGIYNWLLVSKGNALDCIELAAAFPNSAFTVFCESGEITWPLIDYASEQNNIMLAVPMGEDAAVTCDLLREAGLLYSVYMFYDDWDLPGIQNGDVFCEMEQLHPAFSAFLPKNSCTGKAREAAYQAILRARMEQEYATILWDLHRDHLTVDKIISEDGCWAGFDSRGRFYNITDSGELLWEGSVEEPLEELLKRTFPKE